MGAPIALVFRLAGVDAAAHVNVTSARLVDEELNCCGLLLPRLIGCVGLPGSNSNQCIDDQSKQGSAPSYLNGGNPGPREQETHFSVKGACRWRAQAWRNLLLQSTLQRLLRYMQRDKCSCS